MKKKYFDKIFFKSRIFRGLFSSYVVMICLIFIVYLAIMAYETKVVSYEKKDQYYNSRLDKFANSVDSALMDAMIISSYINASDVINRYAMQNKGIIQDSISESSVISEIKNYMISRYNIDIYDTMLFLNDSSKAFSSVQEYELDKPFKYTSIPDVFVQNVSLNNLLGMNNSTVIFEKNFAVYTQRYNSVYANGLICILIDVSCVNSIVNDLFKEENNIRIYMGDDIIYETGDIKKNVEYISASALNSEYDYKIEVDKKNFAMIVNERFLIIIIAAQILSVLLIIISAFISVKFYKPVGEINKLVNPNKDNISNNEFDNISEGIKHLIYENNDYKEKIISIKPYAQKGILQGMLSDSLENNLIEDDSYGLIHKKYYIIADINIAYVADSKPDISYFSYIRNVIEEQTRVLSDEETDILLYDQDRFNIFVIVNSNIENGLEDIIYELHKGIINRIDTDRYAVTIGADKKRTDISQLTQACHNCMDALNYIITAGRNAVYFYVPESYSAEDTYYFPIDAVAKLSAYIINDDTDSIKVFLEDVMNVNMKKHSDNISVINILIDELHVTTAKVLKKVFNEHPVNFKLEKIRFTATIEEIFSYYEDIYSMACNEYMMLEENKTDIIPVDNDIINEINDNLTNPELSLAYLTEKFNVSNKYITTLCKRMLGMTYIQYVQRNRIELAKKYIREGKYTLDEISQMCGYTSPLTFRRNFKNITGYNPSEYRD